MPDGGANAVVAGTYADLKLVKTRSVCQMVIEVPIERAEELVQKFGIPQPGQEIHVAVARLQVPAPNARPHETERSLSAGAAPARAHKSAEAKERYQQQDEMQRAVTRASLLCKDPEFRKWAHREATAGSGIVLKPFTEGDCASWMRDELLISSRSEIAGDEDVFRRYLAIETGWKIASGQMAEQRA